MYFTLPVICWTAICNLESCLFDASFIESAISISFLPDGRETGLPSSSSGKWFRAASIAFSGMERVNARRERSRAIL